MFHIWTIRRGATSLTQGDLLQSQNQQVKVSRRLSIPSHCKPQTGGRGVPVDTVFTSATPSLCSGFCIDANAIAWVSKTGLGPKQRMESRSPQWGDWPGQMGERRKRKEASVMVSCHPSQPGRTVLLANYTGRFGHPLSPSLAWDCIVYNHSYSLRMNS